MVDIPAAPSRWLVPLPGPSSKEARSILLCFPMAVAECRRSRG
jgi:coronamic acid synthetase CmaT thioesterase component